MAVGSAGDIDCLRCWTRASDCLKFQEMLRLRGRTTMELHGGERRVLSEASVAAMCSDLLDRSLGDASFNSHAADASGSAGIVCPSWAVHAPGQGQGASLAVVVDPNTSRLAGAAGSYSSRSMLFNTEWWNDPINELCVFYGTRVYPTAALPQLRQQIAGAVYGAMLPPAAAAHFRVAEAASANSWAAQAMNMMMMASMFAPGMSMSRL